MSGWQPQEYDPRYQQPAAPEQWGPPMPPTVQQPAYAPQPQQYLPVPQTARRSGLTAAGTFWYVLGCIPTGAMYFAKVPAKKAMSDFGMCEMTAMEKFWYVLMCIAFGSGYFAKLPTAKALSELPQFRG